MSFKRAFIPLLCFLLLNFLFLPLEVRSEPITLLSYEQLVAMSESKRVLYLQRVREILAEYESRTESNFTVGAIDRERSKLVTQLEILLLIFAPAEALAKPMGAICIGSDGKYKGWSLDGQAGCDKDAKAVTCPDGSTPAYEIGTTGVITWVSCGAKFRPSASSSPPTPALTPAKAPPAEDSAGILNNPQFREYVKKVESSGNALLGDQEEIAKALEAGGTKPSELKSEAQPLSAAFDAKNFEIEKTETADDGWKWLEQAKKTCPLKGLLGPKECSARKVARDKKAGCLIGGVKSDYGPNGKSKFCQPVRRLCYSDSGKTLINDKCDGRPNTYECPSGKTVCRPLLGTREAGDTLFAGADETRSRGAFCAPLGGRGAKSATAVCAEWNQKYEEHLNGKGKGRDLLATGNVVRAQTQWEDLRGEILELCSENVTARNCEACQIMKMRIALLRKEITGSAACIEPNENFQDLERYQIEQMFQQNGTAI